MKHKYEVTRGRIVNTLSLSTQDKPWNTGLVLETGNKEHSNDNNAGILKQTENQHDRLKGHLGSTLNMQTHTDGAFCSSSVLISGIF